MTSRHRPLITDAPPDARPSGVLSLLFPDEQHTDLKLLLIRRVSDGTAHSGQISFPGGKHERTDADLRATALREAQEEVGLPAADVQILGALSPLYIPVSNFMVYPFVGFATARPSYLLSEREVAAVIEAPLSRLLHPQNKIITQVRPAAMPGLSLTVPAYHLDADAFVWGATAMIISELEALLLERRQA
jgi:8-oxo-dGTP pyrophosphatase MutT (NUDIX family)